MLTNKKTIVLLPLFLMIGAVFFVACHLLADLPSLDALHDHVLPPTTQIFDRHGRLLYEMMDPQTGKHSYVPLEEIPLALRQATIATEDATFYDNPGVDLTAIVPALWINLRGGEVLSEGVPSLSSLPATCFSHPVNEGNALWDARCASRSSPGAWPGTFLKTRFWRST